MPGELALAPGLALGLELGMMGQVASVMLALLARQQVQRRFLGWWTTAMRSLFEG